ncbi:MAG: SufD family Fe-S cluster assembly protein [Candidatus Woesearchaeota archaeon]|jgi:Fe-S cluster assembly scaffold protein SufB
MNKSKSELTQTLIVKENEIKTIVVDGSKKENTNLKINCDKKSKLNYYFINFGENTNTVVELEEESEIKMINIILLNNQKEQHDIKIIHRGKKSRSYLENKVILSESETRINGLIRIEKTAEDAEGYQKTDVLILKNSKAISVPDLEIENNQVKCTHSSSISRIDAEKIFYLQSRGLRKEEAIELIITSFIESSLYDLEEKQKEELMTMANHKIKQMKNEI